MATRLVRPIRLHGLGDGDDQCSADMTQKAGLLMEAIQILEGLAGVPQRQAGLHRLGQDDGNPVPPDALEMMTEEDEGTAPAQRTPVDFPYWLYPPVNWENLDEINYALLGAIGSTVTILSYVVPPGRNAIVQKVANNFVGGGWVEGTGDLIWRILVDGSTPPGATSYDNILASLGSPASPTQISGFRLFENQVLTVVCFNNPGGPNGGVVVSGQRIGARVIGFDYPREIEASDIWI
jgi:hypothetical protein